MSECKWVPMQLFPDSGVCATFLVHLFLRQELHITCYTLFLDWRVMVDTCSSDSALQGWTRPRRELLPVLTFTSCTFHITANCLLPYSSGPSVTQTQSGVTRSVPQGSMHWPLKGLHLPRYLRQWPKAATAAQTFTLKSWKNFDRLLSHWFHKGTEVAWNSTVTHSRHRYESTAQEAVNLFSEHCCPALCGGSCDDASGVWLW